MRGFAAHKIPTINPLRQPTFPDLSLWNYTRTGRKKKKLTRSDSATVPVRGTCEYANCNYDLTGCSFVDSRFNFELSDAISIARYRTDDWLVLSRLVGTRRIPAYNTLRVPLLRNSCACP